MSMFNGTVASITMRATLGRKRALLFALPAVILILVTLALKASHPAASDWPSHILGTFGFTVVLPLTALIIGGSVLGAEIDDGSIVHLLATPVRRSTVIMTKFAVATALTMVLAAGAELVSGLIATGGATKLAIGVFAGALAGSVIYNAVLS
jgi:ABC-2 type transport system permease protein